MSNAFLRSGKIPITMYPELDAEIRSECQTAKELMLTAQCEKIEQLDAAHKSNQVHSQIRQATGRKQSACVTTCSEDKDGNLIMELDNLLARWHAYIRELYDDIRGEIPHVHIKNQKRINASYQKRSRVCSKRNVAEQSYWASLHLYRNACCIRGSWTDRTQCLTNMMYQEGCFPVTKVSGTGKCETHRTISLMGHVNKLVLWVFMDRLRARSLMEISQVQYVFMPDSGTRNTIFVLRRLVEHPIQKQKYVLTCFIDYSKAFDTVKHASLFDILSSSLVPILESTIISQTQRRSK